jgi:predicted nucleic acid-binding protein
MSKRGGAMPVVLDTNVVLDWLVFAEPAARRVGDAITNGALQWLATPRILQEWNAVLARPLTARWEDARQRALTVDVAARCRLCAEPGSPALQRLICRDPTDQVFIDLAAAHGPALLLTRDRALLELRRRAAAQGVTVTTPALWLRATGAPSHPAQ